MTIDSTREFSMMTPGVILTPSLCRRMATVLEDERPSGIVQLPEGDFFDSDGEPKKQTQILINPAFSEVIETSSAIATKRDMRMGWYREDLLRVMDRFKQSSRIEDRWESAFNPRQWGAMEGTLEVFQDELGRWYRHTILSSWDHLPHFRETHILIKNLDW